MRFLIADDDDAIRRLLALEVRASGYEVIEAEDGERAVALALELRPVAVFLDVLMPKMNGFEALAELRAAGFDGKVVMVTALTEHSSRELEAGAAPDDRLFKPFRRRDVQACLERIRLALAS